MSSLLEVENISRSYGHQKVLTDVSLTIEKGQLLGITGENGSGKSTLMQIITGMQKPDSGKLRLSAKIGYCPQEILLFEQLTIYEHFKCWAIGYDLTKKKWQNVMEKLLDQFRFGQHLHKKVDQLSGGTKQKLNLSLALLHHPDLLVLDEPYSGFDWETYLSFWEYASEVVKQDRSIIVVSHFITDQQRFHRIFNLQNGILI